MATEKLYISGWDNGWPLGFISNVDEPISSADGSAVGTPNNRDVVVFDLTDVANIVDDDVITNLIITVRARQYDTIALSVDYELQVELLIGGVSQGVGITLGSPLTTNWQNLPYSKFGGWNQDWTAAQLDTAQVRVRALTSPPDEEPEPGEEQYWYIDAIDVDITYTAASVVREPDVAQQLVLTGQTPVPAPAGNHKYIYANESAGAAALLGKAPGISAGVGVPAGALALQGKVSYLNSLQLQLQVSGWDSGWPTGFVSNIDDTTANPDGSTISTTIVTDTVVLSLDDVTGTIIATDEVVSVTGVIRGRSTTTPGTFLVELLLGGVVQTQTSVILTTSLQNHNLFTATVVGEGWTVAQLNDMQVRVTAKGPDTDAWYIDALDVTVEYTNQSALLAEPGVADALTLTGGTAPALFRQYNVAPAVVARALTGKVPTLFRQDSYLVDERFLLLAGYTPAARLGYFPRPSVADALTFTPQNNALTVAHVVAPPALALTFTGKVPVPDWAANHQRYPARVRLQLFSQNLVLQDGNSPKFAPVRVQRLFVGKVPVPTPTLNIWEPTSVDTLALSGKAPTVGLALRPAAAALSLVGKVPATSGSEQFVPSAGTQTLAGKAPTPKFSNLPVASPPSAGLYLAAVRGLQLLGQVPTVAVDHWATPGKAALTFVPDKPLAQTTAAVGFGPPRVARTLTPQTLSIRHTLSAVPAAVAAALSGTAPTLSFGTVRPVGAAALTLSGAVPALETFDNRVPSTAGLALATTAPVLDLTSGLRTGQPGLISLSIDYDIEFIATPTDILLD